MGNASKIILGDNIEYLRKFEDNTFDLIYVDPPFNTGHTQKRTRIRTIRDKAGDRTGFAGTRYKTIRIGSHSFADCFDEFLEFIEPRLVQAFRVLKPTGSFFLHIDFREVHYCKILLDKIFGRDRFMNEIIWSYDYGGRPKNKWPAKHDNILWYAKDPDNYTFNYDAIDRVRYMAEALVSVEKAERGKVPTDVWWQTEMERKETPADVWWQTIVPTNGKERTGYPTQKPVRILERIIKVHTNKGDVVLDFFAGSGTLGEAAARNDRRFILIDSSEEAVKIMAKRLSFAKPTLIGFDNPIEAKNKRQERA